MFKDPLTRPYFLGDVTLTGGARDSHDHIYIPRSWAEMRIHSLDIIKMGENWGGGVVHLIKPAMMHVESQLTHLYLGMRGALPRIGSGK